MRLTLTTFNQAGDELSTRRAWIDDVLPFDPIEDDGDLLDFDEHVRVA